MQPVFKLLAQNYIVLKLQITNAPFFNHSYLLSLLPNTDKTYVDRRIHDVKDHSGKSVEPDSDRKEKLY